MERLSRAEKRLVKQQKRQEQRQNKNNLELKTVTPKTLNQEKVFKEFINGKNLLIHGLPGTGKSFISLYLALSELEEYRDFNSVTIIRSVVPSRDMGFLPGSIKDKSKVYEAPYQAICNELYNRGDAYEILKQKGMLNFETSSSTTHLLSTNFPKCSLFLARIIFFKSASNLFFEKPLSNQ